MPISDFLHRAASSKARGSSTPRSQSNSAAASSNNSEGGDEHDMSLPLTDARGRTSPRAGPSSAISPVRNGYGYPDEKRALSPETQSSTVAGEPPAYRSSVIPREDVVYTFVRASPTSMIVRSEVTGEAVYHVSHALDLWNPFVWVTTVRRGDEDGEVVSEFEMGLARRRARLALRGQDDMLVNVVKKAALWGSLNFQFRKKRALTWTMQKNSTIQYAISPDLACCVCAYHIRYQLRIDGQLPDKEAMKNRRTNDALGASWGRLFSWEVDLNTMSFS
ncbi:hypothetical protein RhiJN_17940 [Ceratobasidium sp. AG-Ba]|nr:hypothetical protein RhiJN_17940 [Ceratobasidium sp. AG-Ba]